jgi:hypothetical protein
VGRGIAVPTHSNMKGHASMSIYCTYLTIYSGNKLPPFYIGSSSLEKIEKGYCGTVLSKKYINIWKEELKNNRHLFKTKIISRHETRKEALDKELFLHKALSVVKSPLYINMSFAAPKGFFGISLLGVPKPEKFKQKLKGNKNAFGNHKPKTPEHRNKIRRALQGKIRTKEHSLAISNGKKGSHWWTHENGEQKVSKECPGIGWMKGRL